MTAEHPAERLSAYADDELATAERAAVETHLRECASCRQHLADLIAVDEAARALPVQAPPGYFDALPGRVRARIAGRRRRSLPAWTWAAAAALLLAVLTPLTLSRRLAEPSRESAPLAPAGPARDQRPPLAETPTTPAAGYSPTATAPPPAAPAARRRKEPSRLAEREAAASSKDEQKTAPATPSEPTGQTNLARSAPRSDAGAAASENAGAPSEAGAPPPATAEQVVVAPSPEKRRDRPAERGALQPATKSASAAPRPAKAGADTLLFGTAESDLADLAALPQATAAQARAATRAYDTYAQRHPGADQADEARVRAMEALAAAWRLERSPADRDDVRARARAYLAGQGRRRDRVRAVLAALGD